MKSLFYFLLFPSILLADTWVINRDHSVINFEIPYLKISSVQGKFNNFNGSLESEENKVSSISIIIRSETIDTGINLRDSHLRSNDFLASKKYPEISFLSNSISKAKDSFVAKGTLSIKDQEIPLSISFEISEVVQDTWGKLSKFVNFSGTLKKSDLKINWNKTLPNGSYLLGDKIKIKGSFQLQPKGDLTASSKHKTADNKYLRNREKFQRGETKKLMEFKEGIKTMPTLIKSEPSSEDYVETRETFKTEPDWLSYTSFVISFLFGLFGAVALCYFLYPLFEKRRWHDSDFIDDNLKHLIYLVIIGGYVYFASLLFPYS